MIYNLIFSENESVKIGIINFVYTQFKTILERKMDYRFTPHFSNVVSALVSVINLSGSKWALYGR